MSLPLLSIVTGTVDRPHRLRVMLESIEMHTFVPYEVIVADASQDPLTPYADHISVITERPRIGHAAAYNRAFGYARGKWVVWLNDDVQVLPNWDTAAVGFMEGHPWCGLGALYYSENGMPFKISNWLGMIYANFGILERSFGDSIGWFDSPLVYCYGADNSIAWKTLLAGKGIAGIPGSRVIHSPVTDSAKERNLERQAVDAKRLLDHYRPLLPKIQQIYSNFPKSEMVCRHH